MIQTTIQETDEMRTKSGQKENRARVRVSTYLPIRIMTENGKVEGICTDISEDGLAFETDGELDLSSPIHVDFTKDGQIFSQVIRLTYRIGKRYGGYFSGPDSFDASINIGILRAEIG